MSTEIKNMIERFLIMDGFVIDSDDNHFLFKAPFECESYGCKIKKDGDFCSTKAATATAKKIIDSAVSFGWDSKPLLVHVEDKDDYFYVFVERRLV